jgi:hypothetical protein
MLVYKLVGKSLLKMLKFLSVSVAMMLLSMSLISGKFPPPVKEYYTILKGIQSGTDMGKSINAIVEARNQQNKLLENLNEESAAIKKVINNGDTGAGLNKVELEKKIKALEYEVAYYKSKFARSEWEKQQIERKYSSRIPAVQTISNK